MSLLRILAIALTLALAPSFAAAEPAHGDEHAATDDHGAHGDDHHAAPEINVSSLVRHTLNLAVLLAILFAALKGPTKDFLAFRRSNVKEQLDASWNAKADADATYAELEARIDNFDAELARLMEAVREDAAAEKKKLLATAERTANQLDVAAKRSVEEELRRARGALRDQTVALATGMATDILTSAISADDQQRLNGDYLTRVEEAANA